MKTTTLPYWGQIIGLVSRQPNIKHAPQKITESTALPITQGRSLFITRPPLDAESSHTDLYRLDNIGEQISLSTTALPCAMDAIITITDDVIILLGCDGHLYQTDWQGETIHKISQESLFASMIEAQNSTENTETDTDTKFVTKSLSTNSSPQAIAITTLHQAIVVLYPNDIVICPIASNDSLTPSVQTTANQVIVQPYANSKSQKATSLAASSDGKWLVIGDDLGNVSSYQWLNNDNTGTQLIQSSHKALHQGRVNALCFEPIGHYFFSAGTDKQLYRTHVQGELQAIDRAKSSQHSQMITALCVSDTRLFTSADDNSIKSWSFDKGQPNTCKEDLSKTQRLVYSSYAEKPALLAVGSDQSLRFLPIDETQNSKLLTVATVIEDGYHRVQQLLTDHSNNSEVAFSEGLTLLESQADKQTIKLVGRLLADRSNSLSASRALQLVQWLAGTTLETRLAILEEQLNSPRSSGVRLAAFEGLAIAATNTASPHVLPAYLEYALGCANEDVISAALQSYLKIAAHDADKQPRVLPILQQALSHSMLPIRRQALASLEHLLPDISPKADFMALDSRYPDIIQAGLIRLYQRGLLDNPEVSRQLMLLQSHHQADVRQTAFYAALLAQPELITALKQQAHALDDAQLLRTLTDFDDFRLLRGTVFDNVQADKRTSDHDELVTIKIGTRFDQQNKNAAGRTGQGAEEDSTAINLALSTQDFATSAAQTPSKPVSKTTSTTVLPLPILSNSSLEPLLQNLSNRYEDIGFRAAYALACLQDERAFGTLIRFMHHKNDAFIRAGVAAALGYLQLSDGKAILPTLLDDPDASVRQVAMSALGKLVSYELSWVAFGFASKHQDIHERALAVLLTQVLYDKKVSADTPSMSTILAQALNNPFTSIRLEVVKVLLNRALERASKSAIINMIEQLQHSLFEDVHQVALEEWQRLLLQSASKSATTQDSATDTYQAVLTLLFADNFANIRKQAFDTALKNSKRLGFTDLMLTALASPYLDIKRLALSQLQTKASTQHLRALMPALIDLLADDSMDLRQQALAVALAATDMGISFSPIHNNSRKNDNDTSPIDHEALFSAGLSSPYPDIQLTVAKLLASQSRDYPEPLKTQYEANAYAVFEQYLNKEMPVVVNDKKNNEGYKQWHHHITEALTGLAMLSDPQKYHALDWYARYLHHPDADFKALAPKLMYVATARDAEVADVLATWQKDERPIIRQSASLALAVWGDSRGQHFFSNTSSNVSSNNARTNDNDQGSLRHLVEPIGSIQWLQARAGLGITQAQQLRVLFDTQSYAPAARLLLIFNALASPLALPLMRPERLIEALSFADNETAVVYAHVLARFELPLISNWQYLSKYLAQKIDSILSAHPKTLTLLPETSGTNTLSTTDTRANILSTVDVASLQQFAHLTQHKHPLIRAQAVLVLGRLSHLLTQQPYDDEAQVFTAVQSWQRSIEALLQRHHSAPITHDASQQGLRRIDTDHSYQTLAFGAWLGVIRESDNDNSSTEQAIRGLMWLTKASADSKAIDWADSVSRALLPLLHRPHIETRELAWDCLTQLPVPASKLAEYAMSTPYRDMVKRGLQCLIESKDDALANKQLRSLLLTNHQLLAEETYQLLKARVGHLPASLMALHTESLPLLRQLVSEWRQITTRTSNSTITTATTLDTSNQRLSEQALRQDKLTFLLQARHCHDWQARYQTFMQLIEFDEVLFTDTAFNHTKLNDTSLIDELFAFLLDSTNKYEQGQILSLITQVLQSCQRVQAATHNNDINKEHDKKSIEQVAQTAYNKLLDLLEDSTLKLSNADLYRTIGALRDKYMAAPLRHRLQKLFEHSASHSHQERQQLFDTLVMISGYDQPISDYLGEDKDLRWLQQQYLRDPAGLLSLFVLLLRYADYGHGAQLLRSLAWVPPVWTSDTTIGADQSKEKDIATRIDTALALSYEQLPAKYMQNLIEAVAYRAKKRKNRADTLKNILKKALSNKDAHITFLAAEGLALCGNSEGLSTLMASIDYHTDGDIRRRSVLAIGEMMQVEPQPADKSIQSSAAQTTDMTNALYKAYDKLIKLAEDDEHYLQDVASEALGHIAQGGHFEYSAQIFDLLTAQLSDPELQPYNPAITHWLNGLRWLNTSHAWAQIRTHIQRQLHQKLLFAPQQHAISLLSHHDSEANKTLLLDILKQYSEQTAILETAYTAAQNLWGSDADHIYTYDWAAIQNPNEDFAILATLSLKRIVTYSSIDTLTPFITEHVHQLPAQTYTVLQNALLAKPDMSHPQLRSLIDSPDAQIQHIALRYITQYPNQYLDTQMQIDYKQHLVGAQQQWQYLLDTVTARPAMQQDDSWLTEVQQVATTITHLLWITCRYTTPDKAVFTWLAAQLASPIISSVTALANAVSHYWQQAVLGLLARQASDDHLLTELIPTLTGIAHDQTVQLATDDNALLYTLLERLSVQDDQAKKVNKAGALSRLVGLFSQRSDNNEALNVTPQTDLNQQLLAAIKAKDADALYHCAQNHHAETAIRIRAIEALGQLHDPNIGMWLDALIQASAEADSDIQKLAYKVLRRWQRNMTRAQQKRPQAPNLQVMKATHLKAVDKQQNQGEGQHHDQ